MTILDYIIIALAALVAGAVNALAGGGTLITFPVLTALGISPVIANITNTVALCPGYLGGTLAQWNDLKSQRKRLWYFIPASIAGGIVGGILLLNTGEKLFTSLIPYLILLAALLLAVSDPVRSWVTQRMKNHNPGHDQFLWSVIPVALAAIYGGYFGAGLSVIVIAVLGLTLSDNLTKLNALKQVISFSTNISAAIFFIFSGNVLWSVAAVMAAFALLGGAVGGRIASRIKPSTLRWLVVGIGLVVAIYYFLK
jgi:uncharacterized membrane protein YfcA